MKRRETSWKTWNASLLSSVHGCRDSLYPVCSDGIRGTQFTSGGCVSAPFAAPV